MVPTADNDHHCNYQGGSQVYTCGDPVHDRMTTALEDAQMKGSGADRDKRTLSARHSNA